MLGEYVYTRNGWQPVPVDECGYRQQADRIDDYQARRIPESTIPFTRDEGHPDGCLMCGKNTWWESRELPNGERQTRCTECGDTITFSW